MATLYNVHEAKTHLSKLLERAEAGEEIVIARGGKPVARLVPVRRAGVPRQLGLYAGEVWIADDFDATPADLVELFEDGD